MDARLYKRKNIKIQSGEEKNKDGVDIPVVGALPFVGTNGQIFNYKVVNDSSNKSRQTTVKKVRPSHFSGDTSTSGAGVTYDDDFWIDAERVQVGNMLGTNGQIFRHRFNNFDPAPKTPEAAANLTDDDIGHYAVHYIRYYKDNDDTAGPWITVEVIDRLRVIGTNGQIFNYRFNWPTSEEFANFGTAPSGKTYGDKIDDDDDPYKPILGYCNPDLDLMPPEPEDSGIDPPWRIDPFQNVVNLSGGRYLLIKFSWRDHGYSAVPETCVPVGGGEYFLWPGAEAEVFPSEIDVTLNEDETHDATLIVNPEETTFTSGVHTKTLHMQGFRKFDSHCQVCGGSPPATLTPLECCLEDISLPPGPSNPCRDPITSAGVDYLQYDKTYVFSVSPTSGTDRPEDPDFPTEIVFDLIGVPPESIFHKLLATIDVFPISSTRISSELTITVEVYDSSKVAIYRDDPFYPLRKRGGLDNPTSSDEAVQETKDVFYSAMSENPLKGWVDGSPQMFHERYEGVDKFRLRFETFTLQDGKKTALPWPKAPDEKTLPDTSVVRQYTWRAKRQVGFLYPNYPSFVTYINFGVDPI